MTLLIDTDAFWKLGLSGLLPEAAGLFGVSLGDCARLPALPHMLRRGRLAKHLGQSRCVSLLPLTMEVPESQAASGIWLDRLVGAESVDPGEAQLFALAAEHGFTVLTGDKRALTALRNIPDMATALSGRVAVIEAVLLVLCDRNGVESVRTHVNALSGLDTAIDVCFSPGNSDPRAGLVSYFTAITDDVRPLVLWQPGSPQ